MYIGNVGHFWTIQSILCMSKNLTNSVNQRSNTKKQSAINTKSCTEDEYVNEIQKVPEQNFDTYEDIWCYNRPHFGPFYRY